jgi:zinc finger CCHC domain-containing protein 9
MKGLNRSKKMADATILDNTPIQALPTRHETTQAKTTQGQVKNSRVDRMKKRLELQQKHKPDLPSQMSQFQSERTDKPKRHRSADAKRKRREKLKALATTCFHCREKGHVADKCPQRVQSTLCFKCGSTEHTIKACKVKTDAKNPYPHAFCFGCNEKGHIISQCPGNERGVYPEGGSCKHCQSVRHLAKECPSLIKQIEKAKDEFVLSKATGREGGDDDFQAAPKPTQPRMSKPKEKIVKF